MKEMIDFINDVWDCYFKEEFGTKLKNIEISKDLENEVILMILNLSTEKSKHKAKNWRQPLVLFFRFGLMGFPKLTLREIGEMLHLTTERIRQIEGKALRRLKHPSRSRFLREIIKEKLSLIS